MKSVEFLSVTKNYGTVAALKMVDLSIDRGEFFTLLGPSGSGKTTLLNILSGMIMPSEGKVVIEGKDMTEIPPRHRGLGMVFQNYALMPHMTVFQNIAFPLRIRRMSKPDIERAVKSVLEIVQLEAFAQRKPTELSGGQQQRVSIARCLVYKPSIILMDEPLGALDKKLRGDLQLEIKSIHESTGITVLYVTHDQEEALVLSDRICVMNNAQIEQIGSPDELYFKPKTSFVAEFLGESNLIPVKLASVRDGIAEAATSTGAMIQATTAPTLQAGASAKILVRPEAIHIGDVDNRGPHGLEGLVENGIFIGQSMKYWVRSGDLRIAAHVNSSSRNRIYKPGDRVWLEWMPKDGIVLDS